MPKISLWNPVKGNDFQFMDKSISESMTIGGDCALIHMYQGPTTDSTGNTDTDVTSIQDVLFLTNVNRKYSDDVLELRAHHVPQDMEFDLSQFGIGFSSDVIRIQFHYNDMFDTLGRKLIAGDVIEFPSMRDVPVGATTGINRFYVVQDALYSASGYGAKWFPHLWLVKAKLMTDSTEYKEVINNVATGQTAGGIGQGLGIFPEGWVDFVNSEGDPGLGCDPTIMNALSTYCKLIGISDGVIEEARRNAFFDPKFFESDNLYVFINDKGYPCLYNEGTDQYFSGDGAPPNMPTDLKAKGKMRGAGTSFPEDMKDGEYFLRVDFYPERLFQRQGNKFKLIEVNIIKMWTAYNRVLDQHFDNIDDIRLSDGTVVPSKQAVSKVMKQKVDLYASRKGAELKSHEKHVRIANKREEDRAKRGE